MLYSILDLTKLGRIVTEPPVSVFFSRSRLHDMNSLTFYRKTDVDIATLSQNSMSFNISRCFMNNFSLLQSFLCWRGNTPLSFPFLPPSVRLSSSMFSWTASLRRLFIDVDRLILWSQLLQFKSELRVNVSYSVIVTAGSADTTVWEGLRK